VVLKGEGGTLHRSCHALVEDLSDADKDALDVKALHAMLRQEGDVLCLPHVGGRYANLLYAHDKKLERSVEVHSDWGTFDWLLMDAFATGARVGIAANSDGHKGRQGASHPGASLFGAYGGLTCYLAKDLSRDAIWDAMLWRRQYCTTGAARLHCDAWAVLSKDADLHRDDPSLGGAPVGRTARATLGNILTGVADEEVEFGFEISAGVPIERVEIHNRTRLIETWRPYAASDLGRRLRVLWEGSEYRGRGRETMWKGEIALAASDRLRMPAAEDPQGIFRSCKAPDAADAGCIGKFGNAAGAEKTRGADPPGVLKRSLAEERGAGWAHDRARQPGTLIFNSFLTAQPRYDALRDFAPIAMVSTVTNAMVVSRNSPFRTPQDLVAAARARQGRLTYSSGGIGTSHHISMALFAQVAGVGLSHVPYRGAPAGILAAITGEVDVGCYNIPTVLTQIRAGDRGSGRACKLLYIRAR
jgi:hypothetical protein